MRPPLAQPKPTSFELRTNASLKETILPNE